MAELLCELAPLLALKQHQGNKKHMSCILHLSSNQKRQLHQCQISSTASVASVIRKLDQLARSDIIQLHNTRLKSRLHDAAENHVRQHLQLAVSTQPAFPRQSVSNAHPLQR